MALQYIFSRIYSLANVFRTTSTLSSVPKISPDCPHKVVNSDFIDHFDEVVIIGDVHGCYDEFVQLMDQINNNHSNDITSNRFV